MAQAQTQLFDRTAVKVNQSAIVLLVIVGFVADQPWLVALLAVILAVGVASPNANLFGVLYRNLLRPQGWLQPDLHSEDPAPHRFAQGVGASFLALSSLAFALGASVVGWGLALMVAVLAAVNLIFGFCAGCFMYFQLRRFR